MAKRAVAIIQARMGSSRLPGKVLMPLAGRPVLWHIIHRLRKCSSLAAIAIATSIQASDDPLADFAEEHGVLLVRGPEENVLERYRLAALELDADIILRVTGDAPLVDPQLIDAMIDLLSTTGADYCTGEAGSETLHEGFSPFTRAALQRIVDEGGSDPAAQEHVDAYIKQHPERFRICRVPIPAAHTISGTRVSVDTPADLNFLNTLYRQSGAAPGELDVTAAVALLKLHPELKKLNAHVQQKTATQASFRILIRCDGSPQLGLGHVIRCLALAQQLRDTHGMGVCFAMRATEPGPSLVGNAGFPIELWQDEPKEENWLKDILSKRPYDALLLDIRTELAVEHLRAWRQEGLMIIIVDDPSDRRLGADLAFYPPVPQVAEMNWRGFTGILHCGWEWLPLRPGFDQKLAEPNNSIPLVVVCMGGSDPAGLTLRVTQTLIRIKLDIRVRLILGQGYHHHHDLAALRPLLRHPVEIFESVVDMPAALAEADLVVATYGVTAWELAALGIPSVLLAFTDDHARSAAALHQAGISRSMGEHSLLDETNLLGAIEDLLTDASKRKAMRAASAPIDGRGAPRIARCITELLNERTKGNDPHQYRSNQ